MPTGQTDRRTDARLLHYAFCYGCGQHNKHVDHSTTSQWITNTHTGTHDTFLNFGTAIYL